MMNIEAAATRTLPIDDRHAKGSAMSVIESERLLTLEKTHRLRAMRLEQQAAAVAAEPKAAPAKKKALVRKAKSKV